MLRIRNLILILAASQFLCSCDKMDIAGKKEDPPPVAQTFDGFTAELKSEPTPNGYYVEVRWPTTANNDSVIVKTGSAKDAKAETTKISDIKAVSLQDRQLIPGETYRYTLGTQSGDQVTELGSVDVKVPVDLVYKGRVELTDDMTIKPDLKTSRIFFMDGVQIVTNGFNLEVESDIVFFNGTSVIAFENKKAVPATNAKHGGLVRVHAKKAIGGLNIEITGQDGGDGIEPPQLGEEGRGPQGPSGAPAQYQWMESISCAGNVCISNPTSGGQGGPGYPGKMGIAAGDGGNTTAVDVSVEDSSEFTLNIPITSPGHGGAAAQGGRGGPGGHGGFPGTNHAEKIICTRDPCPDAAPGPEGVEGSGGPTGPAGRDGRLMQVCTKLSKEKAMECK